MAPASTSANSADFRRFPPDRECNQTSSPPVSGLAARIVIMIVMMMPVHHPVVMSPVTVGADALDMMMVADLGRADFVFEADDLFAVLT